MATTPTPAQAVPPAPTTTAITPEAMQKAPAVNYVPPATPTAAPSLQAQLMAQTDAFTQNLQTQRQSAETQKNNALSQYLDQLKNTQGQTMMQNDAYAQGGQNSVNALQLQLNDINSRMMNEQRALQLKQRSIQENTAGRMASGISNELSRVESESLQKQADMSIIQMGLQGRYDSARQIADRAVQAKMEQQKILLDALKFNYDENKDLFTKAEQREYDALLQNRERAYQVKYDEYKSIQELAIQALADGAPPDVVSRMQSANSRGEAVSLGGHYVGLLDRQAKQASITASYASAAASRANTAKTYYDMGLSPDGKPLTYTNKQMAVAQQSISSIDDMLKNKTGLETGVGTSLFSRSTGIWGNLGKVAAGIATGAAVGSVVPGVGTLIGAGLGALATGYGVAKQAYSQASGQEQSFLGSVNQLNAKLTLGALQDAKKNGATFGALSDGERNMLAQAGSRLGSWAVHEDGDVNKPIIGYNIDEATFKKEINNINNFAKLDFINRGGNPAEVGAKVMPDGAIIVDNGDGTYSQLNSMSN